MYKAARAFSYLGRTFLVALIVSVGLSVSAAGADSTQAQTQRLLTEFQRYSGANLVFDSSDLPRGRYHDIMLPLTAARQRDAAAICLREVKKYPPNYLGEMGLKAIGVFSACASRQGDGYRAFDREIGGYRYYGIWNGTGGIAAAYYSDGQLPLTFHHEIFHHIDGTQRGECDAAKYFASDDRQFAAAIAGTRRYEPPRIGANDLNKLRRLREGHVLKDAVSAYSAKAHGEDQAETARHFMTTLPDALVQIVDQPELAGSQRLLHCLTQYAAATKDGASVQWFVDVALGRADAQLARNQPKAVVPATATKALPPTIDEVLAQLSEYSRAGESGWDGIADHEEQARSALSAAATLDLRALSKAQADAVVTTAADVTHRMLRYRLRAAGDEDARYAIHGREDASGVNWTLRQDVESFGQDALRLKNMATFAPGAQDELAKVQLQNLRLVARYYAYIDGNWSVTGGTKQAFESTRDAFADALPAAQSALALEIRHTDLDELARRLPVDGTPKLLKDIPARPRLLPRDFHDNPYLSLVDEEIRDADRRAAIRRVQPACVRFSNGSGSCISPHGVILTAGHVAKTLGVKLPVMFPDGTKYIARCTAISEHLDLAVLQIDGVDNLPYAPLSPRAPEEGTWICAIGQPGSTTPSGSATGYGAFHVSTGQVRGFQGKPLDKQSLGGLKHDAWTYWGHSGCPLFNADGEIVAIHNSWDSTTAMRHGVTYEAIAYFLKKAKVDFAMGQ